MKSDIDLIQEAYEQIIQVQPALPSDNTDHGCDAHEMATSQIESIAANIQSIYSDIQTVSHIEPWVAEKITLANDYLNTIQEWLKHQAQKQECNTCWNK